MKNRFIEAYLKWVRRILPSPFTIALVLTLLTLIAVCIRSLMREEGANQIMDWWSSGLWTPNLLVFAVQMMLMLVLGHVLALSPIAARVVDFILKPCTNSANAAFTVALTTMLVGFFNWGLGLVFGAILARKVGEKAYRDKLNMNYPLIGAAGYSALLVWHGGISGSSLIKVAESGHLRQLMGSGFEGTLPDYISLGDTVFSGLNITTSVVLLLIVPTVLYFLGKSATSHVPSLEAHTFHSEKPDELIGAEQLDYRAWFSRSIGFLLLIYCIILMASGTSFLGFFNPNNINLLLFGLCLASHRNVTEFLSALDEAIRGASGILIQFPLYFGILALMDKSGLILDISRFFTSISTETTYPLITFISAGFVNIFVPSGGGQWAIQGPIIIQSTAELGVPLYKGIMAMAYGDEVTNMLQPFWALPLLGITRLSARDILPYTLIMFLMASLIFMSLLLVF